MAAQLIWAFTSVIDKIVISKGYIKSPFVYIVLNGAMNVFLILLLPFFSFEPLKFTDFLIALFSGIMLSAAVAVYYKAVQFDEISKIKIMFQIEPIFVLALSFLFLGEVLTRNYFLGFLSLIVAGLLVSYEKAGKKFKLSKAFYLAVAALIFSSFYVVSAKYIYSITAFWSAFLWIRLANSTALFVLFSKSIRSQFIRTFKNMRSKIRNLLIFKMVIDFSAFVFAGYALLKGPVSLISALSTAVAPLFTFAIALFMTLYFPMVIKEKIDKRAVFTKLLAILLIIAGIAFINR